MTDVKLNRIGRLSVNEEGAFSDLPDGAGVLIINANSPLRYAVTVSPQNMEKIWAALGLEAAPNPFATSLNN